MGDRASRKQPVDLAPAVNTEHDQVHVAFPRQPEDLHVREPGRHVFLVLAGLDAPMAALGASIPAVIFGAFIGTAFFIGRASDAAAARAHS